MKKILKFLGIAILGTLPLSGCGFSEFPKQEKLADIKSKVTKFSVTRPRGRTFRLVLGVKEPKILSPDKAKKAAIDKTRFRGTVLIQQAGKTIVSYPISAEKATNSNWLQSSGYASGYILAPKPSDSMAPLDDYLAPGQKYDVTVTFSQPPTAESSVWLAWLFGLGAS
jgi:hypothetical protein